MSTFFASDLRHRCTTMAVAAQLLGVCMIAAQPGETFDDRWLELKFREGLEIELQGGVPKSLSGAALESVKARRLLADLLNATWQPTHELGRTKLRALRAQAEARSGRTLPDLSLYYRVRVPDALSIDGTLRRLRALSEVENVYRAPRPPAPPQPAAFPPDFSEVDDGNFDVAYNRNVYQRSHDAAPDGLGFRSVRDGGGGRGAGVRVCDVEYSWNDTHADLPAVTLLGDEPSGGLDFAQHGTAVLGVVVGVENGFGITGMAPDAEPYFAAAWAGGSYNPAGAISRCANQLFAGDVILVQLQALGPNATGNGEEGLVPLEWVQSVYDAIVTAVAAGIVVVEAAGNGGENLDDAVYAPSSGAGSHKPFQPVNASGAIIVGAGYSAWTLSSSPRARASFSNYGSVVRLQAWGDSVVTAGIGDYYDLQGESLFYSAGFGGSSSAAAMVAAGAAVTQSTYRSANASSADPATVASLLITNGTPQTSARGVAENIGPQPDLAAVVADIWSNATPAAPILSPAGGAYAMPLQVTIDYGVGQSAADTTIRYTLDGSEPTENSFFFFPEQGDSIYLNYGATLKARSFQLEPISQQTLASDVAAAIYASTTPKVATPVITPGAGAYNQPHQVTITTATPGATIRYRTDGRSISFFYPGTEYEGPVSLDVGTHEVTARAYKDQFYKSDSASSGAIEVVPFVLPTPVVYPNGGSFVGQVTVYLGSTVLGADLRYTLDGSDPTPSSPQFAAPIELTSSATVKARIYLDGYTPSEVLSAAFDVTAQVLPPGISPNGNTTVGSQTVTLSSPTPGALIRYTTNGAQPTTYSTLYSAPFDLGVGVTTVKARAFLEALASDASTAEFTVFESGGGSVADPIFTPFSTQYFVAPFTVAIRSNTQNAEIRYTMAQDSSPATPDESSALYSGPIPVNANGNYFFKARAYRVGLTPSNIVQTGQLSLGSASGTTQMPTINPPGGTFYNPTSPTLSAGPSEVIFYTRDGSEPVAVPPAIPPSFQISSGNSINIFSSTQLRAQAYRPFYASGGIAAADFTFVCATPTFVPASAAFLMTVDVEIETITQNAQIYYTTDGSEPTQADALYTGAIPLGVGSHGVRAKCFKNGYLESETALGVFVVADAPSAPQILTDPVDRVAAEGQTATFAVTWSGFPTPEFQWRRDGVPLAGAVEPELELGFVSAADAGLYDCVATNTEGTATSTAATLTVVDPLPIFSDGFESGNTNSWSNAAFRLATEALDLGARAPVQRGIAFAELAGLLAVVPGGQEVVVLTGIGADGKSLFSVEARRGRGGIEVRLEGGEAEREPGPDRPGVWVSLDSWSRHSAAMLTLTLDHAGLLSLRVDGHLLQELHPRSGGVRWLVRPLPLSWKSHTDDESLFR